MRSLVSERIVIISIFMGWLSEIVIAVPKKEDKRLIVSSMFL